MFQIHTFCDASEEGYCVAVYIRIKEGQKISTNLLTAKSRVSPLKAESIAPMELIAFMCTADKFEHPLLFTKLNHVVK